MLNQQRGKPLYVPATKEEMLYYADWRYVEGTPWQKKLAAFLIKRMPKNWYPLDRERALWEVFFGVRIDGDVHLFFSAAEEWGLVMKRDSEVEEFVALCMDYTNHARLFVNRGHTPAELSALMLREQFRTQDFPHESVRTAFLEELERVAAELGSLQGRRRSAITIPAPVGVGKNIRSAADGELKKLFISTGGTYGRCKDDRSHAAENGCDESRHRPATQRGKTVSFCLRLRQPDLGGLRGGVKIVSRQGGRQ